MNQSKLSIMFSIKTQNYIKTMDPKYMLNNTAKIYNQPTSITLIMKLMSLAKKS